MIDRRNLVGSLGAAGLLAVSPASLGRAAQARRPNIIFIMADDLGYADLSCNGSRHIRTPAIDRLSAEGVHLRQGYANSPVCSPSRTALLTGCYQYRFPVGLEEPLGPMAPQGIGVPYDQPTIASELRSLGYQTKLVGKWHLGDLPLHGPLRHGYDRFFGVVEGAADYFRHHIVMDGKEVGLGLAQDNDPIKRTGYLTDLFGDEAVRTIEAAGETPLFMSMHFTAPHWPWETREDSLAAEKISSSFHYDGGNLATYKAMVEAMDDNVRKILDALDRTGKAANTIVVFTSDNGGERFSDTWPFIGIKGELLEGGIRVPLLVRWPARIPPGTKSDQVMMSMDFLPTLMAMAGGSPARGRRFDGADLSAILTGAVKPVTRTLFWRFKANDQAALRLGDLKYLKIGGKEHLFNLAEDERERAEFGLRNPQLLSSMRAQWAEWNRQMLPYSAGSYSAQVKDTFLDRY